MSNKNGLVPFKITKVNAVAEIRLVIDNSEVDTFISDVHAKLVALLAKEDNYSLCFQSAINVLLLSDGKATIDSMKDIATPASLDLDPEPLARLVAAIDADIYAYYQLPENIALRGVSHVPLTDAQKVKMDNKASKLKAGQDNVRKAVEEYVALVDDRAGERYGTMDQLMDTAILYKNMLADMRVAGILTDASAGVLESLLCLPRTQSSLLIKLLATSGLATSIGGPNVTVDKEGCDVVTEEDAKEYLTVLEDAEPPNMSLVSSFMKHPPGEHSAFKHASLSLGTIDHPIGIPIPDPNALLKPVIIMHDTVLVSAAVKSIFYNYQANHAAACSILRTVMKTHKSQFNEQDREIAIEKNIFSCSKGIVMDPVMSRYTIRPLLDKKLSTATHQDFEGIRFHSQRSDKEKVQVMTNDPEQLDELNVRVNFIPTNVFGGSRADVCAALMSTKLGGALIARFVRDVEGTSYKKTRLHSFTDYQHFYQEALFEGQELLDTDSKLRRALFITQPDKVLEYWNDFVFKTVMKILSAHLGFLSMLGTEMSVAGLPCLPGIFSLKNSGVLSATTKPVVIAINCHATLVACKIFPDVSDFYSGQQVVGGIFPPLDEKIYPARGVGKMSIKHEYVGDTVYNDIVKHKRYNRVGALSFSDFFKESTVLFDLTIPGLLYIPQNAERAKENKEFKGQGVLIDDPHSQCLYDYATLAKTRAFMVYVNLTSFLLPGYMASMNVFKDFGLNFSPVPAASLLGVYLVGWRKSYVQPDKFNVRDLPPRILRNNVIAHLVTKSNMVNDHFSRIPVNPQLIYDSLTGFLPLFGLSSLELIRHGVGTVKAVKEYIKRTRESVLTDKDFRYGSDYASYKGGFDPSLKSALDKSLEDEDGEILF